MILLNYYWITFLVTFILFSFLSIIGYFVDVVYVMFSMVGFIITGIWFCWQISKLIKFLYDMTRGRVDPSNKSVLITGCSSGFGFELAIRLDTLGYNVIAGVRITDDERARSLRNRCSERLKIIKLDVTKDEEVDFAVYQVEKFLNGSCEYSIRHSA